MVIGVLQDLTPCKRKKNFVSSFSNHKGSNLHQYVDKKEEYYDWTRWGQFEVGSQESEEALRTQIFPFMLPSGYLKICFWKAQAPPSACLGSDPNEVADIKNVYPQNCVLQGNF